MGLLDSFRAVRAQTLKLVEKLETEDLVVQSMPDASPARWHLAHTTWFFDTFVAAPIANKQSAPHPAFAVLFNSYYNGVGEQFPRHLRGTQSRPTVSQVLEYRKRLEGNLEDLLLDPTEEVRRLVTIGLHHEQQHQELLVTDLKHALVRGPLFEALVSQVPAGEPVPLEWVHFGANTTEAGHLGSGFCFDNELPRHRVLLSDFSLANRPVTNGEFLEFVEAGGYTTPELWLSDGLVWVNEEQIDSPLYWEKRDGDWVQHSWAGTHPVDPHGTLCHVSYFEADAYARFRGARLPTEFEWETAVTEDHSRANFADTHELHPAAVSMGSGLRSMFGGVWEWTQSAYAPYPGYRALPGALGEYNGKFMNGQYVLRGGSCATPEDHIRPTYRNFFGPDKQWQFSGIRLAKDNT